MSDLISRQAAIDALNEYFARIGKLKRRGLTKGEKAISLDTVGSIKTLPSAQSEQQWIPVSERLPESDVDVLTQYSDGSMSVDFRIASSSGWFWADEDLPIAWMPLPEPYKAESEGKE